MNQRLTSLVIIIVLVVVGILIALGLSVFSQYLGTRAPVADLTDTVIGGALNNDAAALGDNILEFRGQTKKGEALRGQVSFKVAAADPPPGPGDGPPPDLPPISVGDHQFDTWISETPVGILSAYELSGPVEAQVNIRVQVHTNPPLTPPLELSALATYTNDAPAPSPTPFGSGSFKGRWALSNIQTTGGSAAVPAPTIAALADDSSYARRSFVTLTSSQRYRATVTIQGTVTSGDVAPVLLPRFKMTPFVGNKTALVIKARLVDDPAPNTVNAQQNAPYGTNDAALIEMLERMKDKYENMSSGAMSLGYEIREATFSMNNLPPTPTPGLPPGQCPRGLIGERLLQDLGISPQRYQEEVDLVIFTFYQSTENRLNQEFKCRINYESAVNRGVWIDLSGGAKISFPHELGHGFELNHVEFPGKCEGESPDIHTPPIEQFYSTARRGNCRRQNQISGHVMAGSGFPSLYYHQMDRASLGWLTAGQMELITASGVYDLYSERDDFSSPPDAPLILQVPVEFNGYSDFLYLTMVNPGSLRDFGNGGTDVWADALQGVRVTTAQYWGGVMKTALGISHFWYGPNATDASIPTGGYIDLKWPKTDVRLEVVSVTREEDRTHAKVKVMMNGVPAPATAPPLPAPAGLQPTPTPGPAAQVSRQPTLRWQPVPGAARYQVRVYHLLKALNAGYEVSVPALATEFTVPQPLENVSTTYDYEWNVQAIDAEGNGGLWSPLQKLNVVP